MDIKTLEAFSLSDAVKFHDELNPKLWRNNELRPDVKKQLLLIAQDFMQELGLDDLKVEDITISGSNAAYTYTDHSDLDLHILVDFKQLPNNEVYQELFNAKKTLYNDNHDITVHGVPIELYVQDTNQVHHSLGEYSLKNNTWTRIPKKRKADLDQSAARLKYDKLYELIHLALKSKNIEKINELLSTIKRYRQAGLDQGGEFGPENLAFKALRSQGLINKLYALKNKLHSDELTIETVNETNSGYKEIEFVCANPEYPDATDEKLQRKMFVKLKKLPGVIPLLQDHSDMSSGQKSLTAIYKDNSIKQFILKLAKELGINVDIIRPVSDNYVDRAIRGEHEGQVTIEDYDPNGPPPGPEFPPTMPAGTVRVDVSDVYDWYKLGQHISNMKGLGKHDFGKGPPSTIMSFGDEDLEHQYIQALQRTGLSTTDIDPAGHKKIKGQKTDPTYNVNESSFNKCFDKACEVYDKALKKNLKPVMYQVADYVGDAENADSKWQELPKHVWSHYVTVVNDIVLDPTAKQFGDDKPTKYSFDELQNNWKKIFKIRPKDENLNESNSPKIAYHVTATKNLPFIQHDGIKADSRGNSYVWDSREMAEWFMDFQNDERQDRTILKIDMTGLEAHPDPETEDMRQWSSRFKKGTNGGAWIVSGSIPPNAVLDNISESASGYIPSKKQANDPRYKTALTVDVKPDTIRKNAKAFGFKVSRAGIPPLLREGGAETSWSHGTEKVTLQDILELTKHIRQINLPINDNLKNKLIHWDGNPEEIERINHVTVSNQFPILIIVDEQGEIQSILDGNHRLHKAIKSQAETIPAKLIKPSDLSDKAKRIFHIKEQGVAEQKNANTITAYHGTRRDIDKFKPFSHFGTFRAAYDRLDHTRRGDKKEIDNEQIYQVELDINNPIELDVDIFDNHKLSDYVELLQRKKVLDDNEIESIKSPSDLLKILLDRGYDGIKYKNRWEHPGSTSYVIFKPEQVKVSDIVTHNQPNKFRRLLTKN